MLVSILFYMVNAIFIRQKIYMNKKIKYLFCFLFDALLKKLKIKHLLFLGFFRLYQYKNLNWLNNSHLLLPEAEKYLAINYKS